MKILSIIPKTADGCRELLKLIAQEKAKHFEAAQAYAECARLEGKVTKRLRNLCPPGEGGG